MTKRHKGNLFAAFFGFLAIFSIGLLEKWSGYPLLFVPFAASSFLLFAVPNSPFARPKNFILGYLVTTLVGLGFGLIGSDSNVVIALAVATAIFLMLTTHTSHPPAAGAPIVILLNHSDWSFLLFPIMSGVLILASYQMIFQRFSKRLQIHY